MIMTAFEADAKRMGRLEGRSEGAYQKSLETAKNLLGLGLSVESIAQVTGLSKKEVEALK